MSQMPNLVTCASNVFLVYELQCSDIIVDIHVEPGWASFAVRPNLNKKRVSKFYYNSPQKKIP